jgi:hypothetical protein
MLWAWQLLPGVEDLAGFCALQATLQHRLELLKPPLQQSGAGTHYPGEGPPPLAADLSRIQSRIRGIAAE